MPVPAYRVRFKMAPAVGRFNADSFDHLMQRPIQHPSLDRQSVHTLIDAEVAPDGSHVELHVHSQPMNPMSLDNHIRILNGCPPAYVRAQLADGTVLFEGTMPAPLRPSQRVAIGQAEYYVGACAWPGRDPQTGVCKGDVDWQQCIVTPISTLTELSAVGAA
jgi:hypothetical protein